MKLIGNIIWLLITGLWSALAWFVLGIILHIFIITIPFGRQCFKFAELTLMPFGKKCTLNFDKHPIGNIIWLMLFGWELAAGYFFTGLLYCITIIGIPFGLQSFKLAKLALFPMGAKISG